MSQANVNPIQDGPFRGDSQIGWGGGYLSPPSPPKIYHTYPKTMKLDTVIPYLRKIQKIYKSPNTFLEFC